MAGSIREFRYKTNKGEVFAINADESLTELLNASLTTAELNPTVGTLLLPVARLCRKARYTSLDGKIARVGIVLDQAVISVLPATITVSVTSNSGAAANETLTLRKSYEEKFSFAKGGDTGLNDGD